MAYGVARPELRRKLEEKDSTRSASQFEQFLIQEIADVQAKIAALDRRKLIFERKLNTIRNRGGSRVDLA